MSVSLTRPARALGRHALPWLVPALLVAIWQLASGLGWINHRVLPAPLDVLKAGIELTLSGDIWAHLKISFWRVSVGFAIGGSLGLVLGLVSGLLAAWLCTRLPRGGQLLLALLALAGSIWLTELWPLAEAGDSGEELALFRWNEGHLRNLNALADFASRWWPWAAIGCLSLALWRILWSRFRPPRPDPIG